VSFLRKQESRKNTWIPTFVGMTYKGKGEKKKKPTGPLFPPHPTLSHQGRGAKTAPLHLANVLPPIKFTKSAIFPQFSHSLADVGYAMWCARCEQDVPGLASPQNRGLVCARCGGAIAHSKEVSKVASIAAAPPPHVQFSEPQASKVYGSSGTGPQPTPTPSSEGVLLPISSFLAYDDWQLELSLRQIGRRLRGHTVSPSPDGNKHARLDAPHPVLLQTHWPLPKDASFRSETLRPRGYAQLFLYGGLVLLTSGLTLLLWGYLGGRPDLPVWGWPCLLLGQALLLFRICFSLSHHSNSFQRSSYRGAKKHSGALVHPSPLVSKNALTL